MDDIMKLLFGREDGILSALFGGHDADGFGLADRARRAGEWCGSTPGSGSPAGHGARLPRGPRHVSGRGFRVF